MKKFLIFYFVSIIYCITFFTFLQKFQKTQIQKYPSRQVVNREFYDVVCV